MITSSYDKDSTSDKNQTRQQNNANNDKNNGDRNEELSTPRLVTLIRVQTESCFGCHHARWYDLG